MTFKEMNIYEYEYDGRTFYTHYDIESNPDIIVDAYGDIFETPLEAVEDFAVLNDLYDNEDLRKAFRHDVGHMLDVNLEDEVNEIFEDYKEELESKHLLHSIQRENYTLIPKDDVWA
jgi:hypothetical protein